MNVEKFFSPCFTSRTEIHFYDEIKENIVSAVVIREAFKSHGRSERDLKFKLNYKR